MSDLVFIAFDTEKKAERPIPSKPFWVAPLAAGRGAGRGLPRG